MKTLAQQLGEYVRDMRLARGLSQVEFGERCGFDQTYLSRIERGQANPTLNAMEVIANGLGISVFEMFEAVGLAVSNAQAKPSRKRI